MELNVANALLNVRFISIFSFNFIHTVMTNIFIFRCLCSRGVCVVEIHKKALQRAINHRRGWGSERERARDLIKLLRLQTMWMHLTIFISISRNFLCRVRDSFWNILVFYYTMMAIKNLMHQIYLHKGVPWIFLSFHVCPVDKFYFAERISSGSGWNLTRFQFAIMISARYNGIKNFLFNLCEH